jgi:hypothetical protein
VITLQNVAFLPVCLSGMLREESDVEALIAENQDDFFRMPEIHTRFNESPGVLIIYKVSGNGPFLARPGSVTQNSL